jgi:hypothetical protein
MRNLIFVWMCLICVIPSQARTITVDAGLPDFASIQTAIAEPNVTQEWVARYDGGADGRDSITAMAIDESGNIFVTGVSQGLGTGADYATIKYDPNGQEVWVARYNGDANDYDGAWAIGVDGIGNVYVGGASRGVGTDLDWAIVKYDSDGNEVWVSRYNGAGDYVDFIKGLLVDEAGYIYVTGYTEGTDTDTDYTTIKYDSDGNEVWVALYNGPGNWFDLAQDIAIDSWGNVYVTGISAGLDTGWDCATIKYDADGNEVWVARYEGPSYANDDAYALAVDGEGYTYVAAMSNHWGTGNDYVTIKYDPNGQEEWVARYNGDSNGRDVPEAVVLDNFGGVYVTGCSEGSGTEYDWATVKYDANGNKLWTARYNGPGNEDDEPHGLVMDRSGYIYVTGNSRGLGSGRDCATIKYDPNGQEQWVARYNSDANSFAGAWAIGIDSSNNVYVAGKSVFEGPWHDYATIKYSQPYLLPLEAEISINPQILNLQSKGRWIMCVIYLPEDYNVAEVDPNSILLEEKIEAERVWLGEEFAVAKFSRLALQELLADLETPTKVELVVSGELNDGTIFQGTDTIRVIDKGKRKNDSAGRAGRRVILKR